MFLESKFFSSSDTTALYCDFTSLKKNDGKVASKNPQKFIFKKYQKHETVHNL